MPTKIEPGYFMAGLTTAYLVSTAAILILIILSGCSKSTSLPTQPQPRGADTTVSFSNQVQPIFTANCALGGCHSGPQPQDGMSLAAGSAYNQIVNKPCIDVPGYLLVKPFFADSSFLYLKITGNPIAGIRMPYGRPPLPDSLIVLVGKWINQGALNN
jgi:hypothetical protein